VEFVFLATVAALALSTVVSATIAVRARRTASATKSELRRVEQQAQHDLRLAEESKVRALSKLSHDLRTPLSTIVGWAQVLRAQNPPDQMLHGLEVIERNARVQTKIIQDLLEEKKDAQDSVASQSPGPRQAAAPPQP
jgi:signal transduction histidine kinase